MYVYICIYKYMYVSIYVYIFIYVFIYISNVHTSKLKARQRPPTIKVRSDLKASSWVIFTCKYFFLVMFTSDFIKLLLKGFIELLYWSSRVSAVWSYINILFFCLNVRSELESSRCVNAWIMYTYITETTSSTFSGLLNIGVQYRREYRRTPCIPYTTPLITNVLFPQKSHQL